MQSHNSRWIKDLNKKEKAILSIKVLHFEHMHLPPPPKPHLVWVKSVFLKKGLNTHKNKEQERKLPNFGKQGNKMWEIRKQMS